MVEPQVLGPLLEALAALVRWLREENLKGIAIGGVAVAALGRPRMTGDVDALVWLGDRDEKDLLDSAARFGLEAPEILRRLKDLLGPSGR